MRALRCGALLLLAAPVLVVPGPAAAAADTVVAPGVSYRVLTRGPSRAYVATLTPSAASTARSVLATGRLGGAETTSSMSAREGAALGVNGDFGLSSGRPVHAFAGVGQLVQTAQAPGRGVGLARSGAARLGFPAVDVQVGPLHVSRWNSGAPTGSQVAGFTTAGGALERPPGGACYATLVPRSAPVVGSGGRVVRQLAVRGTGCTAHAPGVPAGGVVLVTRSATALRALDAGSTVTMTQALGFTGSWSLVGASESLVTGGRINAVDVDQPGPYVQDPAPRTAVGRTADGRLLLVVVDGRQPGWSTGMTLRQLARLLVDLGAREAVNLDGGGSSTMWVRGRVVNRPSDGVERAVSSALVVLPGSTRPGAGTDAAPSPAAATDAASTGGLADALARRGDRPGGELADAAARFRSGP